jgi:hypothetical protein
MRKLMRLLTLFATSAVMAGVCVQGADAAPASQPSGGVAPVLEENAEALLPLLTNPTGDPGEGHVEKAVVFSGKSAVRIVPMQRFSPHIAGWAYHIVEKPAAPDEFRYFRFAWKVDGSIGCMVQLHDDKDWYIRYCAGVNAAGWAARSVSDKPPAQWTLVTVDLFKDFGEHTIRGIALTTFNGNAGYFDHIYFGRTIADLDRIDATGLQAPGQPPLKLSAETLNKAWDDLSDADASKSYNAFWTLVADPERAAPLLKRKLAAAGVDDANEVKNWINQLADDAPEIRERATERLKAHISLAKPLLEAALADDPPPEAGQRIKALLRIARTAPPRIDPSEKALRALEYCKSAEASGANKQR